MTENNRKKKLLAILGSPRENGSTAAMLRCALNAADENGWEISTIYLYRQNIGFCKGCRACGKTGKCVINDDIQEIAHQLKTCDRVILAAPTYWANVPAVVKNMFDRLVGTAMEETSTFPRPRLSRDQSYLLLTACNTPSPFSWICGQSKGTLRAMKEFFKTSGMKQAGSVVFSNAKGRAELPAKVIKKIKKLCR
ncbi:flavodoxin family protein [Anaerolentibacter hominis]|uniref:flavodoxin family protein n=1 Tax=Anaerolentibacter hominis TaxID=3079009 RepID=UPI0031B87E5E